MGSRRKNPLNQSIRLNKKQNTERYDEIRKLYGYFGLFAIVILMMSSISYESAKNGPEYIEQKLIEFYKDSCQLSPKVGFKTVNGLRGAYAKGKQSIEFAGWCFMH